MSPQDAIEMKNTITFLMESIDIMTKDINSLKLDQQRTLRANTVIPPGVTCKVAYDSSGLVIKSLELEDEDIPQLSIDKISGLRNILNSQQVETKPKKDEVVPKRTIKAGTGTKVNYDENGLVTSSTDLTQDDIPSLAIEKITGLKDLLSTLELQEQVAPPTKTKINPGTFPKITFDSDGRVVVGSKLSIDDIPGDIINRINLLESRLTSFASRESVNNLLKITDNKLNCNPSINAGTFTKVIVDQNGLVISGTDLTIHDLPEINIHDIPELASILKKKADQSDVIELNNQLSLMSNSNQLVEMNKIKTKLDTKADEVEVKNLSNQVREFKKDVDNLSQKLPSEHLPIEIKQLWSIITTLTGRISVLEEKMNIQSNFSRTVEEKD